MFSPWYAWARRGGPANPLAHVSMHVALHGGRSHWAMTERGEASLARDATSLRIGPSGLRWNGQTLVIDIDEVTAPLPRRLRGEIRVHPEALTGHVETIDGRGAHRWRPIAPACRVEVALRQPALAWQGTGYLDSNDGDAPLERGFARWDWSRAVLGDGTAILYETQWRDGGGRDLALRIGRDGGVERFTPPGTVALKASRWRIARQTRAEDGDARVTRTLVDAPFYARSVLQTRLFGARVPAVHESVDLRRFSAASTQMMLPFRVPRAPRWHRAREERR